MITQLGTTAETITDSTDSPAAINTVNSSEYKTRKITFNDNGEETPAAGNWNISIGGANYNYLVGNNNERAVIMSLPNDPMACVLYISFDAQGTQQNF